MIDSRVRPRRYVSVSLMAIRWARSAAIRPIPRSVSSGRSPAVPMMIVIGAVRPAAPPAIPSATSRTAAMPASLWAKSTMTMRCAEPEEVEPAGRTLGRRPEVAQPVGDVLDRGAERPGAAGRGQGVGHVVPGDARRW